MQLAFKGDLKVKYGHEVLPIFIELKNYANEGKFANVMDYIIEQFDICQFPGARPFIEAVLHQGKAIVLCDGLLNRRI